MEYQIFISNLVKDSIEQTEKIKFQEINISIPEIYKIIEKYPQKIIFLAITAKEYLNILKTFSKSEFLKYNIKLLVTDQLNLLKTETLDQETVILYRNSKIKTKEFLYQIEKELFFTKRHLEKEKIAEEFNLQFIEAKRDQNDLINIGRSLASIKSTYNLLQQILFLSKKITAADAGSIYTIQEDHLGHKFLKFEYSHTYSKELPMKKYTLNFDKNSIAGYVAVTGEILNIPDVHKLDENAPIQFNSSFDERHNYLSRSMLVVPMRNQIDEIIGVIQLINSKKGQPLTDPSLNEAFSIKLQAVEDFDNYVTPFESRYESLMEAVASQAAIALENNRLIRQIQTQFEEFVKASVMAIESRDPATSGHSFRVAQLCHQLALTINKKTEGTFKDKNFNENELKQLEYASLLHDFGKVYIDLAIFKKSKKLFPDQLDKILLKLDYLYRYTQIEKISGLQKNKNILEEIKDLKEEIILLNEPTITNIDPQQKIEIISQKIKPINCLDLNNNSLTILTEKEKNNLAIKRGSLNEEERKAIESHVNYSYEFVKRIPWPPEYKEIPKIIACHHEKIDGSGYPNHLKNEEIPFEAQMMAIADIYDALTAADRPYKKALPHQKAISILEEEGEKGKLNTELLKIFINDKIGENLSQEKIPNIKDLH